MFHRINFAVVHILAPALLGCMTGYGRCQQPEPPALNPFGSTESTRTDVVPGYLETSDGTVHAGEISLTRDTLLKVFDEREKKHREIPLKAVKRLECRVVKEWMEDEWRFKENANDEKYFTGRRYPAREYAYTVTLQNGRKIEGSLAAIVYVRDPAADDPARFLLHKRDKGAVGSDLRALLYVRTIALGPEALAEGKRRAAGAPGRRQGKPPASTAARNRP